MAIYCYLRQRVVRSHLPKGVYKVHVAVSGSDIVIEHVTGNELAPEFDYTVQSRDHRPYQCQIHLPRKALMELIPPLIPPLIPSPLVPPQTPIPLLLHVSSIGKALYRKLEGGRGHAVN